MSKLPATEVFTPGSFPSHTYVERSSDAETLLQNTLETRGQIASISGPSKSGKTVLVERVTGKPRLISIAGARISSQEALWDAVLDELQEPHVATAAKSDGERDASSSGTVRGANVAGVVKAEGTTGSTNETSVGSSLTLTSHRRGFTQVVEHLADSDYVLFVDDFHYMRRDVQAEVAKGLKEAAQKGLKICVASVPHRADDVVRALPELIGRVRAIDLPYWTKDELRAIADKGFAALNAELDSSSSLVFCVEAAGSPQLMQQICLETCFFHGIRERAAERSSVSPGDAARSAILEQAASATNFRPVVEAIHTGPRRRGTMRRTYKLRNGADGDVYSCILHAVASDPPALSFRYEDLMQRIARICDGDAPKGSSVIGSCQQMHRIAAKQAVNQRALEWDDGRKVLDIPDPYLVFYLRWSNYLVNHADEPVSATLATITEMRDARAGKRTSLSSADAKLLDELALEKLIRLGAAQGYVTYDDFNEAMPEFLGSNEDIDRWLLALNKAGIDVRPDAEKET